MDAGSRRYASYTSAMYPSLYTLVIGMLVMRGNRTAEEEESSRSVPLVGAANRELVAACYEMMALRAGRWLV